MPKVVRIIARLNVGGPATHVIQLTDRLRPAFDTVLVSGIEAEHEGNMLADAQRLGIPLVRIPELGREINLTSDLLAVLKLVRLLRKERPDIVHTHTAKAGFVGRLAARLCGVPVVLHTFHGHVLRGYFGPLKTRAFIMLERLLARATDQILTVSQQQRRELAGDFRIAPAGKIRVMPLGLPLEPLLRPADPSVMRTKWDIPPDIPVVGIVARLTAIKGHELFLDMAAELHRRRPDVRFVLIGDGERRADLEAYAAMCGAPVVFGGWEPNGHAPAYYAALDVACLTSFNEGSPVTLIEAMAAGKPVVSTAVGGVPDVVRHGVDGFLVHNRDPAALADYVEHLIADRGLAAAMGQRGRAAAYPKYDVSRLVRDMAGLYDELLATNR